MPRLSASGQITVPGVFERGDLLVGEDLIDGRAPEVAVGEVRGCGAVELQRDLVAVVGEVGGLRAVGRRRRPGRPFR